MFEFNATFLIAMLSFSVFIFIMNAIFYNPILGIIRKREDYISSNYEESERFKNSANDIKISCQARIEQTQDKCRHEFKSVVEKIQTDAAHKVNAAREKSKLAIQTQKGVLTQQEEKLKTELKSVVVKDLASSIVSKLLGQEIKVENFDCEPINKVMD